MKQLRNLSIPIVLVALVFLIPGVALHAEQRLALKGYDPVAYFTEKRPMMGDTQYQYEWDGVTYRFASARHLALFKAEPDRYLPQYNNLCAASLAQGVKVAGNPEYWMVVDGRLYLFGGPPGAMAHPKVAAMKSKADENWARISKLPDTK